ncbi:hypothetical protein ACIBQX_15750 [Nonomuraea sp. NPDC049714]|uniref:hypothetical protein n=1 Tax=Nonomuraea sp. NPDC049714 TaxID=3364357 RepID=UPI0037A96920
MALGLAAGAAPAQAATTTASLACDYLKAVTTNFRVIDNAAMGGVRDGRVSKADLRAVAAGKTHAENVGEDYWFAFIDSFNQPNKRTDGFISPADLRDHMRITYKCG